MPPYAICLTDRCEYLFDFRENKPNRAPRLPPYRCPTCKSRVIFYCFACRWPILTLPDLEQPRCGNCTARLRGDERLFERMRNVGSKPPKEESTRNCGASLSPRELDVLKLLVTGKRNKEVASSLGISPKTVDSYLWRIKQKTNAPSSIHLVHYAIRHQIVEVQQFQDFPDNRRTK
jgi:DNA-binding CsgD family transcriptional regulator